jgi:hypothetical protein
MSYNPDWEKRNRSKRSARKRELRALKKQAQATATLARPLFQPAIDLALARRPSGAPQVALIAPRTSAPDSVLVINEHGGQKASSDLGQSLAIKELAQLGLAEFQILDFDPSLRSLLIRVKDHGNFTLKKLDDRFSIQCSGCRLSGLISQGYLKEWIKAHVHH